MPWLVRKVGEKWKVYKEGEDGQPVGEARGTFDTEEEARQQQKALYVRVKEDMEANLILGSIKFTADEEDPRFLRFKRAVLARAEVNGNNDIVTEDGLKEVASTLVGTGIDLEHADTDNYGYFTAGSVG